jgi:hypothetical protein
VEFDGSEQPSYRSLGNLALGVLVKLNRGYEGVSIDVLYRLEVQNQISVRAQSVPHLFLNSHNWKLNRGYEGVSIDVLYRLEVQNQISVRAQSVPHLFLNSHN